MKTSRPDGCRARPDLPRWAFGLAAAGLPWLLFCLHHRLGHQADMRFFYDWFQAVRESAAVDSA